MFRRLTSRWNLLLTFATALSTCIGGFLILPPLHGQANSMWSHFGVFAVTLLVGLWFVPLTLYSKRKTLGTWVLLAIAVSVTAIVGFFYYQSVKASWTYTYDSGGSEQLLVKGIKLTDEAAGLTPEQGCKASMKRHCCRGNDYECMLNEMGGNDSGEEPVFNDTGTVDQRTNVLLAMYLIELYLLATAVITVVQTTYCANLTNEEQE